MGLCQASYILMSLQKRPVLGSPQAHPVPTPVIEPVNVKEQRVNREGANVGTSSHGGRPVVPPWEKESHHGNGMIKTPGNPKARTQLQIPPPLKRLVVYSVHQSSRTTKSNQGGHNELKKTSQNEFHRRKETMFKECRTKPPRSTLRPTSPGLLVNTPLKSRHSWVNHSARAGEEQRIISSKQKKRKIKGKDIEKPRKGTKDTLQSPHGKVYPSFWDWLVEKGTKARGGVDVGQVRGSGRCLWGRVSQIEGVRGTVTLTGRSRPSRNALRLGVRSARAEDVPKS